MKRLPILIALVLLLVPASASAVGFQSLQAPDPQGQPLELGIWYPSDAPASPQHLGPFECPADLPGPVEDACLPALIMKVIRGVYYGDHHESCLRQGERRVVMAGEGSPGAMRYYDERQCSPGNLAILAAWSGRDRLDPARIGIFGFSAGGFTALAAGRPMTASCRTRHHRKQCMRLWGGLTNTSWFPVRAISIF